MCDVVWYKFFFVKFKLLIKSTYGWIEPQTTPFDILHIQKKEKKKLRKQTH